ncbi:glutamate receptor 3-like [Haliotis rufescens]|uniref:glutamate receptor 3-like n=1 Tax=Haliotis rufescens TaxID=6454 RepID=UPI00201F4A9F|nr:glutamate receptor 3-like [Haliotis rufescens]
MRTRSTDCSLPLALLVTLWTCGPDVDGIPLSCRLRNTSKTGSLILTPFTRPEVYVPDVVSLLSHLQWTTITVLHDTDSEELVDAILFLAVEKLRGVRYLIHNVEHMMEVISDVHTLLQSLHATLFPRPFFLLIGRPAFILDTMSLVSSHDGQSNRTTDYRHLSRWLLVTDLDRQFLDSMINNMGDLENVAAIYKSDTVSSSEVENIPTNNSINIITYSRSCPPDFIKVKITPPVIKGRPLLHAVYPNTKYGYNNRTLVVSTLMYAPFTMRRQDRGHVIYEGYCFEVLNVLAKDLNFSVQLVEPDDGEWGLLVDGKWTGLIGQLEQRDVDMVVAPLTIHEDRERVMDFLLPPFYTENVDILYKFEDVSESDIFVTMKPFKIMVLVCLAAAVVVVFIFIFFTEQCSQYLAHESRNTDKRTPKSPIVPQSSTLMSSFYAVICFGDDPVEELHLIFWRVFGSVFKQGDPWISHTTPGRILMTSWWLLTVVLAAGYSAYLVAILAVDIRVKPFRTLQDVVDSPDYTIGIMSTGIIKLIFEKSNQDDFKGAWQKVVNANKTDPRVLAGTESEHLQHVLGGKFCWIVDVTTAEKAQATDCALETVGVRLNGQNLALAAPTNSPLKPALEDTMSAIADSGLLEKWWKQWQKPRTPDMCPAPPDVRHIILNDVMGPVYIALGGVALAGLFLVLELLTHRVHLLQTGTQTNKTPT